ncbi:mucin-4 [Austrofundulus limnaeus]|uniref:Mucin-4-like n=1 Tax=Austrofundulus limnaeus TaxID=52670 RepID=A0A2I4C4M5_AUSLI|nr:PREDICTED: mucin-4-like [Austrofundulus limnaeus]XP_013874942.1 PREDICTED: mucin-4-like [Austrofundulus limnaeus]
MSCHKHNFQCFSAEGEGSHQHHTTHLPRIPHHGMAAHHNLFEGCFLCSEYEHAQALEAAETHLLPFYHPSSHRHPHQCALRELRRPEETHSCNECHRHHHRFNKKVVLVKNSEPSCRKTIVLRRRGLHSFALFLEEVSELMHYHVRKLYTQDGHKIDSVQSLLQCPGVLVCVGREPSHPSVIENFQKTFSNKLPKLSAKLRSSGHTDERLSIKTNGDPPNLDPDSRATKQSSSEKSRPDGTDSPDAVGSGPPTGNSVQEDDIEKLVRVNKDGSLTMEMKVRFRLQNDQTLQWSTKVRKTTGGTSDHIQGHNNPCFAQVCDVSCSESENISADEACFTQRHQGHTEELRCAHLGSQDHDDCKNVPRAHTASRCILTSSSSASSLTVVSRKTVVERQTVSRSSGELTEGIVEKETCVTQRTEAAETMELCTVRSETCSPKSKLNNMETAGSRDRTDVELDVKTAQEPEQEESVSCTSQILGDEENQNDDSKDTVSLNSSPETKEAAVGRMLDTGSPIPHPPTGSKDKISNTSRHSRKLKTSKPSHACYCGVSPDPLDETKGQIKAESEGDIERDQASSMSVKSNRSNKSEKTKNTECKEDERESKSVMSVHSNASTKCSSDISKDAPEQTQTGNNKETQERQSCSVAVKPMRSNATAEKINSEEDEEAERALSAVSSKSKASVRSKGSRRSCAASENKTEDDFESRTPSVMSALSNVSAELKQISCETSEEESSQHSVEVEENENESEARAQSAKSEKSNRSRKSRSEVTVTESAHISDNVSNGGESEQSTLSVMSVRSDKSNMLSYNDGVEETPDTSKMCEGDDQQKTNNRSSCMSDKSVKSNISVRSSQSKCDKSDKESNDEERGPSVMSVKSNLSVKSTFSNASAKSNPLKQSDNSVERLTEQSEGALSNTSTVSDETFMSNTCGKCVSTDVHNDASEETVPEGETGRSVSSVSELSDKSTVSTRSNRSAPKPAAERTEILCAENEEVKNENRATSRTSVESHSDRASSALSAKSAKSCKSTKSNASKVCSKTNSDERNDDEKIQERVHSAMSAKTIESTNSARSTRSKGSTVALQETNSKKDTEQAEERPPSSTSARTMHSHVSADRPQSASSVKSSASTRSVKTNMADVQILTTAQTPGETQGRPQSGLSDKPVQSEKCEDPADENRSNHEEHVERVPSNMSRRSKESTKTNVSQASKRSKVVAVCLEDELGTPGGESEDNNLRPTSSQSVDSNISVRTNKSNSATNASFEDDSKATNEENDKDHEERPPSSLSTKSVQSSVSEISIKSAEKTQSALSTKSAKSRASVKSVKSSVSEACSGQNPAEETHERAQSALSAKTVESKSSVKSKKSEKLDDPTEKNLTGEEDHIERASSNLSVRSEMSTVSNVSSVSERKKRSEVCLEGGVNSQEKKTAEEEIEERLMSPQSVVSNRSTKSVQSTVSEISVKSAERASSVKSSAVSVKTNVSDMQSGKPAALPDEADSENETRTRSVVSVKSTNSGISGKSTQTAGPNDENRTVRSPSSLSAESETSPKSNVSTASEGVPVEDAFNNSDVRTVEEREVSLASPQTDRSPCPAKEGSEITDDRNNTRQSENSTPSSMSAKSVQSHVSEGSSKSADRPQSAKSAKSQTSARSVKTDVSAQSRSTSNIPEMDDDANKVRERTNSALSAKTTKSTTSTASTKLKANEDICGDEEHEDKSPSNMSSRSAKSTVSTLSQKSKVSGVPCEPCAENYNEEKTEEDIENESVSSMSIYSVKTNISSRSNRSKNSINFAAEENLTRTKSNASTQILSSTNTPEGGNDDRGIQSRPESAVSAKSRKSAKSKRSKVSATPTEESALEFDHEERPESTQTIKSNMSAKSKDSKCPNAAADKGCNEETAEDRAASCTSFKTSLSDASDRSSKSHTCAAEDVSEQMKTSERAPSTLSAKSAKSLSAKSSHSAKSVKSTGPKGNLPAEVEREESLVSDRSENETQPQTPTNTVSKVHEPHPEELSSQEKTPSVTSVQSSISEISKKSKVLDVPAEEITTYMEERTISPVSAISNLSDVPAVTVEESEDRSPTTTSTKSKASAHSKKSKTSEIQGKKGDEKSQSSLSVRSHLSVKTKKSKRTDISTASIASKGARKVVSNENANSLHKKGKENTSDKESLNTNKSRGKSTEETRTEVAVENSTASQSAQKAKVICHAESSESDLSQTVSSSDIIKEICGTSAPEESNVSKRIANGQLEAEDNEGSVTNKSDKSCKISQKNKDADDFELVTSILPNSSPTEVVNEWLKGLPEEGDIYNLEELNEDCDELKSHAEAEEVDRAEDSEIIETETENKIKGDENMMNVVHSNECQTSAEATHEDSSSTQREAGSKMINSSIQVMKVLLNPKLDRCNSLPEISPVYGRKLSTSAKGLLDCLVKLQLIDHDPKNANEKDKRYQELMGILQSLWLSEPPVIEHVQNKNEHRSVDEEYNHTSSSGVDVNSGSTGSGKSSDGVKSSNDLNGLQARDETKIQWQSERGEEKQEHEDPGTDETIRSNDSPREPPETPSSSDKTSADSSSNGQKRPEDESESQEDTNSQSPTFSQKLDQIQSQDLDPVWVLTLLTKIENQFMTHYTNAMQEFKVRLNLEDRDQLDVIINQHKTEIQRRIQTSIDREVRRIQIQAGLPRPPKEAASGVSPMKSEERRQRRKIRLQQSMDSQAEKSDDSAAGTSYSDQRNDNIEEGCPCETCIKEEMTPNLDLAAIVRSTAPIVMDSSFKKDLLKKTNSSACAQPPKSESAPNLVDNDSLDDEIDKTEDERTESESAVTTTAEEKTSDDTVKKKLMPALWIIPWRKGMTQSVMHSEKDDTAINDKKVKEAAEEAENKNEIAAERQTDGESEEGEAEVTTAEDKDAAAEVDVATTECKSSVEENEGTNDDISSEENILETTSHATTAEDEEVVVVAGEPASETDKVVERTAVTDLESDTAAEEKTGSENGIVDDIDATRPKDEKDATSHNLSSELAEEPTEDEFVVEETSEKEKIFEESEEEATCPSGKDSTSVDDSSETPDEMTTARENAVENQTVVSEEDESKNEMAKDEDASVASSTVRESDDEEAVEVGNSDAGEETGTASENSAEERSSEDETEAPETSVAAASEHESEEDASKSEEVTNVEKLPDTKTIDSDTADESSEESSEEATTNDDMAVDDETAVSQEGESKDEDGISDETEKEEATDGDEETSEADSAEGRKSTTNEEDVVTSALSEQAENDPEDKQAVEEETTMEDEHAEVTTLTTTSQHESEDKSADEELANFEDKPAIAKKPDLDVISENENEEEGTDAETTEGESGKDVSEEDEKAEDKEIMRKMREKASIETTEAVEEETDEEKQDICDGTDTLVKNDSGEEDSERKTGGETVQEATDENESEVAEDEKESSEKNTEDLQEEEEEQSEEASKSEEAEEGETPGEESDDESESKESETEDQETKESKEPEEDNKITKSGDEKEFEAEAEKEETEVKFGREESTVKADDDVDAVRKFAMDQIKHKGDECQKNRSLNDDEENAEESEKEDEEMLNEDWSGNQGASADGGDEAEEDSDQTEEEEEETERGQQPFIISKADVSDELTKLAKETMLMPLDGLKKQRDESEDGAYADVEDSETEINSQEEDISLESKGLKKS